MEPSPTAAVAPANAAASTPTPAPVELAEKAMRFGRIAEEADDFQRVVWRRISRRAMVNLAFSNAPVWRRVRRSMRLRQDLFQMDTPPEIVDLVRDELTPAEQASPYAAITTARFSLPELARLAIRELALDLDELEAIEALIESRRERFSESSGKTILVFALAALSWLSGDIPDEVITHWGWTPAAFKVPAFYLGCGFVGFAVYLLGIETLLQGRIARQARLSTQLIAHCRAQLKSAGAG